MSHMPTLILRSFLLFSFLGSAVLFSNTSDQALIMPFFLFIVKVKEGEGYCLVMEHVLFFILTSLLEKYDKSHYLSTVLQELPAVLFTTLYCLRVNATPQWCHGENNAHYIFAINMIKIIEVIFQSVVDIFSFSQSLYLYRKLVSAFSMQPIIEVLIMLWSYISISKHILTNKNVNTMYFRLFTIV